MATAFESIAALSSNLSHVAPYLRPQISLKGMGCGEDFLLNLCHSKEKKEMLKEMIDKHQTENATATNTHLAVLSDLQVSSNKLQLDVREVRWMSQEEFYIHNFVKLIEIQLNSDNDDQREMVNQAISCFLKKNGRDSSEVQVVEECLTLAYGLQTLVRAFGRIPISIQGRLLCNNLQDVDVADTFGSLLSMKKTTPKSKKRRK